MVFFSVSLLQCSCCVYYSVYQRYWESETVTEIISSSCCDWCGIFESTLNWISEGKSMTGIMRGGEGWGRGEPELFG